MIDASHFGAAPRTAVSFEMIDTPVGSMLAVGDDALRALEFSDAVTTDRQLARLRRRVGSLAAGSNELLRETARQLRAYFAGDLREFDVPLAPAGSEFQRAVWAALLEIPYGFTRSYGEQARRLGRADAARAVGAANGDNPIAIIIPCHRVIGSDGSLTGYGGGLWRKRWLLDHESRLAGLDGLPLGRFQ